MKLNLSLADQCRLAGLPIPEAEVRFHPVRRWRFDWAWIAEKVAVEQEGGAWTRGRHTRGAGFLADCEKYNQAALLGWRLIRVTPKQVGNGEALELIRQALVATGDTGAA